MTQVGDRIELIHTSDPYTNLEPGDRGTVTMIDGMGTTHVRWDGGSTLGIIRQAGDRFKTISTNDDGGPR